MVLLLLGAFFCVPLAPISLAADAPVLRTWTSGDGKFSTRAELIDRDDKNVKLRNEAGREVSVPLARLCKEDLAYLKTLPKVDPKKQLDSKKRTTVKKPSVDGASMARIPAPSKPLAGPATAISRAKTIEQFEAMIAKAFSEKNYDLLEATALALRNDDTLFQETSRSAKLELFYSFLAKPPLGALGAPIPYEDAVADWLKARPKSKTIRLAAAQHEIEMAWVARGSGYGNTVTKEGWQVFRARIERARVLLASASDLPGDDPDFFRLVLVVGRAQSWEFKAKDKFYLELMEKAPDYYSAHEELASGLLPRWNGKPGDTERQTTRAANGLGGVKGDELYASVAGSLISYYDLDFFNDTEFDYERIARGYDSLIGRSPNALILLHEAAFFAAIKNDVPHAAKFCKKLKSLNIPWSPPFWGTPEIYKRTVDRAIASVGKEQAGPLLLVPAPKPKGQAANGAVPIAGGPRSTAVSPEDGAEESPWEPPKNPIHVHPQGIHAVRFIPRTRYLVVVTPPVENSIGFSVWDVTNSQSSDAREPNQRDQFVARGITVDEQGSSVIVYGGADQGRTKIWNYALRAPNLAGGVPSLHVVNSTTKFKTVNPLMEYSRSGFRLLENEDDSVLKVVSLETKQGRRPSQSFRLKESKPTACKFSADSRTIAATCENGSLLLATLKEGEGRQVPDPIAITDKPLSAVCFANNDKLVCCAEASGVIHLYDLEQKAVIGKLQAPGELKQIDIHPGGRLLATAHGESDCVCLWDVVTKKEVKRLTGHTGDVNTVSFATNGKVLASGSQDGTIRLWDVPKTQ